MSQKATHATSIGAEGSVGRQNPLLVSVDSLSSLHPPLAAVASLTLALSRKKRMGQAKAVVSEQGSRRGHRPFSRSRRDAGRATEAPSLGEVASPSGNDGGSPRSTNPIPNYEFRIPNSILVTRISCKTPLSNDTIRGIMVNIKPVRSSFPFFRLCVHALYVHEGGT